MDCYLATRCRSLQVIVRSKATVDRKMGRRRLLLFRAVNLGSICDSCLRPYQHPEAAWFLTPANFMSSGLPVIREIMV